MDFDTDFEGVKFKDVLLLMITAIAKEEEEKKQSQGKQGEICLKFEVTECSRSKVEVTGCSKIRDENTRLPIVLYIGSYF